MLPDELVSSSDLLDPQPTVAWDEDEDAWLILTYGSSTCPAAPREISETADDSFEIRLESTWARAHASGSDPPRRPPTSRDRVRLASMESRRRPRGARVCPGAAE